MGAKTELARGALANDGVVEIDVDPDTEGTRDAVAVSVEAVAVVDVEAVAVDDEAVAVDVEAVIVR